MIVIADAIEADVLRIRHEFLEMPGLVLTVAQTANLYALSMAHANTLLKTLEAEGFLFGGPDGAYRRRTPPTDNQRAGCRISGNDHHPAPGSHVASTDS
jgi:hypothetical protein